MRKSLDSFWFKPYILSLRLLTSTVVFLFFLSFAEAQYPFDHKIGSIRNENYGNSVTGVGDVNSDGIQDYAVGSPGYMVGTAVVGKVTVYSGVNGSPLWSDTGNLNGDRFGYSVAGDGSRIIVGAPGITTLCSCSASSCNRTNGYVRIYSAQSTKNLIAETAYGFGSGTSVAVVGDVTGDGISDLLVGLPFSYLDFYNSRTIGPCGFNPKGSVGLYDGYSGARLIEKVGSQFGWRYGAIVGGVRDINGDSKPDFGAMAANQDSNGGSPQLIVYSGNSTGSYPQIYSRAISPTDYTGAQQLVGVGNLNGCNDFAYGDPLNNRVVVISGSCSNYSEIGIIYASSGQTHFGQSVAPVADVNVDLVPDILVVAPDQNVVRIVSGSNLSTLNTFIVGNAPGICVSGLMDINGDNYPDFIVGSPNEDEMYLNTGGTYLFTTPGGSSNPLLSQSGNYYLIGGARALFF